MNGRHSTCLPAAMFQSLTCSTQTWIPLPETLMYLKTAVLPFALNHAPVLTAASLEALSPCGTTNTYLTLNSSARLLVSQVASQPLPQALG